MDKLTIYVLVEWLRIIIALACSILFVLWIMELVVTLEFSFTTLKIVGALFIINLLLKVIEKRLKRQLKGY